MKKIKVGKEAKKMSSYHSVSSKQYLSLVIVVVIYLFSCHLYFLLSTVVVLLLSFLVSVHSMSRVHDVLRVDGLPKCLRSCSSSVQMLFPCQSGTQNDNHSPKQIIEQQKLKQTNNIEEQECLVVRIVTKREII